jgi:hypothetical protein
MNGFERPLNAGCKIKITFMSVPMPILDLYLCILRNFFGGNAEENEKYVIIKVI